MKAFPSLGFSSPFDTLDPYYAIGFILSALILLSLQGLECARRKYEIVPHAFGSMLKVEKRRLRCFGVNVSLTPNYLRIQAACIWILRIAIVVVLCLFWQSTILYQLTTRIQIQEQIPQFQSYCQSGLTCFTYKSPWEVAFTWFLRPNLEVLCNSSTFESLPSFTALSGMYVTCVGVPKIDSLGVSLILALCYALFSLIIACFQVVAWIVYRSSGRVLELFIFFIAFCFIVMICVMLFIPKAFVFDAWYTSVTYISVPMILLQGRRTGLAVREVVQQRLAQYQANPQKYIAKGGVESPDSTSQEMFKQNYQSVTKSRGLEPEILGSLREIELQEKDTYDVARGENSSKNQ